MELFLTLVLAALLLALSIVVLHKFQQRQIQNNLDKTAPLDAPELDFPDSPLDTSPDPSPDNQETDDDMPVTGNWQSQVKYLRQQNEFQQALQICQNYFPQVQAFQQAMLTQRAWFKLARKQEYKSEEHLDRLYRLACLADYFRPARLESAPHIATQLRQTREKLEQFPDLYQRLGYQHLRLLSKTDIRQCEITWGVPVQHFHCEELID